MYRRNVKLSHWLSVHYSVHWRHTSNNHTDECFSRVFLLSLPTFYSAAFVAAIFIDITVRVTSIQFSSQINSSPGPSRSIHLSHFLIENRALGVSGSFAIALNRHATSTKSPVRQDLCIFTRCSERKIRKITGNRFIFFRILSFSKSFSMCVCTDYLMEFVAVENRMRVVQWFSSSLRMLSRASSHVTTFWLTVS